MCGFHFSRIPETQLCSGGWPRRSCSAALQCSGSSMAWCSAQEILRQMLALWLSKHWRMRRAAKKRVCRMGKHGETLEPPIRKIIILVVGVV